MIEFSKEKLNSIAEEYQLADIYFFGSQITGLTHPESDFDVAVRFRNGLPEKEKRGKIYANLFADLSGTLKMSNLDLVFIEEAPLHIQFQIINKGKLVYSHHRINSCDFQEKIVNYYRDYKYFIDEFFKGVLESSVKNKK